MLTIQKFQLSFILFQARLNSWWRMLIRKAKPSSVSFHRSIQTLPLRNFIDCLCNGNLTALIISGIPKQKELELAWRDIKMQYSDALSDGEHKLYLSLIKEIGILTATYNSVIFIVNEIMRHAYSPDFAAELNDLVDASFEFRWEDQEDYHKKLNACINRAASIKINVDLKKMQMQGLSAKFEKGEESTPATFISVLISLSDFAKYTVTDSIVVFEYCDRIRRLNEYSKQVNEKRHVK